MDSGFFAQCWLFHVVMRFVKVFCTSVTGFEVVLVRSCWIFGRIYAEYYLLCAKISAWDLILGRIFSEYKIL